VEGALAEIPRRHGARQAPGLLDHVFGLGLKAHRVLVTPLRSFAFRKAAMFAAFSLGLLAIKAKVTVQATTWAAAVTIPDPSLGQVIAVSTVVVAFATINAVVFVITQRAQDRMREGYLRVIADSRTPEDLRRELLGRL
jgi:hypothetical protein